MGAMGTIAILLALGYVIYVLAKMTFGGGKD